MRGTKEFYQLMDQFEKDVKEIMYGHRVERVSKDEQDKVPASCFYNDGHVNQLFHAYMIGYSSGKLTQRLEG